MVPAPSPNNSPSLLAINKNIYIYFFFFVYPARFVSRHSFVSTLHPSHTQVNLSTIKHLTQDVIKTEKTHQPVNNGGFIYFANTAQEDVLGIKLTLKSYIHINVMYFYIYNQLWSRRYIIFRLKESVLMQ